MIGHLLWELLSEGVKSGPIKCCGKFLIDSTGPKFSQYSLTKAEEAEGDSHLYRKNSKRNMEICSLLISVVSREES